MAGAGKKRLERRAKQAFGLAIGIQTSSTCLDIRLKRSDLIPGPAGRGSCAGMISDGAKTSRTTVRAAAGSAVAVLAAEGLVSRAVASGSGRLSSLALSAGHLESIRACWLAVQVSSRRA